MINAFEPRRQTNCKLWDLSTTVERTAKQRHELRRQTHQGSRGKPSSWGVSSGRSNVGEAPGSSRPGGAVASIDQRGRGRRAGAVALRHAAAAVPRGALAAGGAAIESAPRTAGHGGAVPPQHGHGSGDGRRRDLSCLQ